MIASNVSLIQESFQENSNTENILKSIQQSPKINHIKDIKNQNICQSLGIPKFNLEQIKKTFADDEEIQLVIEKIEAEFLQAVNGEPPELNCDIPHFLTETVAKEILTTLTKEIVQDFTTSLLKQRQNSNNFDPRRLLNDVLMEIEYGNKKDEVLRQFNLESDDQDTSGRQILENALLQFTENPDFKAFMREIQLKQMLVLEDVVKNPENQNEILQFIDMPIPQEQVDMMLIQYGMA